MNTNPWSATRSPTYVFFRFSILCVCVCIPFNVNTHTQSICNNLRQNTHTHTYISQGSVFLPYRTCMSTIYGRTKFCVRLEPCPSAARRYKLSLPVERVCAKISNLDRIRRRLALGGVRAENPFQEIAILQELQRGGTSHQNVCGLICAGQDDADLYTIWQFCDGGDLQTICSKRADPVPEAEAKKIFKDALRGLAFMHHHGYAHLDISLENIMMQGDVGVLIDFGASQRIRVCRSVVFHVRVSHLHTHTHTHTKKNNNRYQT